MPVEIKELHIRVNIESNANANSTGSVANNQTEDPSMETIVALCVEQVMQILKEKAER